MSNLLLVRTRFIDEHMLRALENDAVQVVILGAGYQRTEKTFFIWEGVSMYLSEEAVRQTTSPI